MVVLNEHVQSASLFYVRTANLFYQELLDKLKNCNYAKITQMDYYLFNVMTHELASSDRLPNSFYDLRDWLYTRVAKDEIYTHTGYRQEHFCIGVLFGACMFADEVWRELWTKADERPFAKCYFELKEEQSTNSFGE